MNKDYDDYEPLAVTVARETLRMHHENLALREEVAELQDYRAKYIELLNSSIAHGETTMGNVLMLALTPGVAEACAAANLKKV